MSLHNREMEIVTPTLDLLPSYLEALHRGFAPGTTNPERVRQVALDRIAQDPALYVAQLTDPEGAGPAVELPNGEVVKRLPGLSKWMWDGEFVGMINLRWQPGTNELPAHVLGHIGYAVTEWNWRRGYATTALAQMLEIAREVGLTYIEITTTPSNLGSQKVILNNGGVLTYEGPAPEAQGGGPILGYRIAL